MIHGRVIKIYTRAIQIYGRVTVLAIHFKVNVA